ncbi:hypothetical protein FYK55_20555 [Roseiconus nitratireducens]|uniref:Uncharacterized protein n=1 Tax=Roseiconus nitratireducens TaxID=2605748 RepID=A0A5M6CZ76_9BACT|nr:hypothetical protein FYK55_20555 [Roseiconus nitratireducens]
MVTVMIASQAGAVEPGRPLPQRSGHPLYHRSLPPGAIWQSPHASAAAPQSTFQPVAFSGPGSTTFAMPEFGVFGQSEPRLMAGLMVGAVYRFQVTNIPGAAGAELFPTVELIGRTYPPPGLETLYPIPINFSASDLAEALDGNLVTRVIYLEDPQTATPLAQEVTDSRPIDIPADQDALATADSYGRPIAIVRIGSVSPPRSPELAPQFFFGHPTWAPIFQPETP